MPGFKKVSHSPNFSTISEWAEADSHENLPAAVQPIDALALNEDRRLGEDLSRITQTARALSARSRLLPASAVMQGMDVRAKVDQLTTVGDEIKDPNHPGFGKHPIDTTRTAGWVIGSDVPTSLSGLLGVGGCFFFSKNKDVRFRTHMTREETGALVAKEHGKGAGKKVAWATLKNARIAVPDLSHPDTLKPGDRVQVETLGTVEAGAYGSAVYLLQAGARFTVSGEFELTVEKTSDHHVEVECVPTWILGAKIFIAGWVFGSAYVSEAIAHQIGQKFRFDLRTEAGRDAYQNALQGKMPGQLSSSELDPTQHNLEKLQSGFPAGIKRLMVSKTTCRQSNAGAKAGFSLPQVGASYARTRTASLTSDGDTSVNQKIYTRATEYSTPLRGSKENGITGCLQSSTIRVGRDDYVTHFDGYKATVIFSDTVVRGDQYATRMLQRLNQDLDAGLTLPAADSPRYVRDAPCNRRGRRVEASVEFTPQDIVDIRDTDLSDVDVMAKRHGVSSSAIRNFVRAVGEAATPVDAAERLGDFLRDYGRPGLGVLIKLARMAPKDIVIHTESGSYQGALTDSVNYLRKHGSPLSAEAKKNDLTARLQEGEKLRNDLEQGLRLLADDPVLDLPYNRAERDQLKGELEGKLAAIERSMGYGHLTPEEGFALWSSLGRGWTTGAQGRAQEQILHGSGLSLERSARTHAHATAVQEQNHRRKGVSLQSATRRLPLFGDQRTLISVGVTRALNEDASSTSRSFTVEARVSDENLRWQGMNRRFIQRINQAYGLDFKRSEVRPRGDQQLVLRQTFTESDLNRIALVPPRDVIDAIQAAGVPGDEADAVGWEISAAASREDLVDVLTRFVQERGIAAAGVLARISSQFDSPVTLELDSLSGAITSDLESVRMILNGSDTPFDSTTHTDVILRRFDDVKGALVTLQNLKTRMLDYPFFSDAERIRQLRTVDVLEESLEKTLDFTRLNHDALVNLCHETKKFQWSTVREAVMTRLETNAGLRQVKVSPLGHRQFSEVLRKFNDGSSVLESCVSRDGECETRSFILGRLDQRSELVGVEAEVRLYQAQTSKAQLQKNFIDPLNRHLSYGAGSIARAPRDFHERRVIVRMPISADEVQTLSALSAKSIQEAAKGSEFSSTRVESLVAQLKQASTGPDKAQVVGHFLAHAGLEGIGAIKSLLAIPNDRISVTSVNGLLEKLSAQVKETLIAYEGTAVTDSTGNKEIKARFTGLSEAEEKVALMKRLASADPFVDNTVLQASLKDLDALARRLRVTQEGTTPPRYQAVLL